MLHSSDVVTAIAKAWGVKPTIEQRKAAAIRINELLSDAARGAENEFPRDEACIMCKTGVLHAIRTRESIDFKWGMTTRGAHARH